MTKRELEYVKTLLQRVKDPDGHVAKALAYVEKDLKAYDARIGQLRHQYELDSSPW